MKLAAKIHWERLVGPRYYALTDYDHDRIRGMLTPHYYFILTYRRTHLSSFLVKLGHWFVTGRWCTWTHALMNIEGDRIRNDLDFRLIEATVKGVHFSNFLDVFDCDGVVLLSPTNISSDEWTRMLDLVLSFSGRKYDNLFDLTSAEKLSCVEVIYQAIRLSRLQDKFPDLFDKLKSHRSLTPQMLYDCRDLKVALEIRR
jgi:hypothetical protein